MEVFNIYILYIGGWWKVGIGPIHVKRGGRICPGDITRGISGSHRNKQTNKEKFDKVRPKTKPRRLSPGRANYYLFQFVHLYTVTIRKADIYPRAAELIRSIS